jgi:hypothetical protein
MPKVTSAIAVDDSVADVLQIIYYFLFDRSRLKNHTTHIYEISNNGLAISDRIDYSFSFTNLCWMSRANIQHSKADRFLRHSSTIGLHCGSSQES